MRLLAMALVLAAAPLAAQPLVRLWNREITAEEARRWDEHEPLKGLAMMVEEMFEKQYLRENGLEPSPEVFSAVRHKWQQRSGGAAGPMGEWFVQRTVRSFYLSRALWEKHGGRIMLSAFGSCVAKDALIQEMRALERAGSLSFPGGARLRDDLYRYLREAGGDGVISGERARKFFAKPPWEN
ncbi:MAG: hypothetical protein ABSE56_15795 [Bryobacteraceae bacterium]|jgi:hypothetical protein